MRPSIDTLAAVRAPLPDEDVAQATGGSVALAVVIIVTVWYLVNVYQP